MSIYNRRNYYPEVSGTLSYTTADWQTFIENLKAVSRSKHVVLKEEQGNIALIAYNIYRTVDVWPYLCHVNDIISPVAEIKAGMEIKYPSIDDLNRELTLLIESAAASSEESIAQLPRFF